MQYLAKCDLIVYDLHFGNPKDVKLAIDALLKPPAEGEERPTETVLILISSLLAWDKTPKNLQEIIHPVEARRRAAEAAEAENKTRQKEEKQQSRVRDDEDEDDAAQSDMDAEMSDMGIELNSNGDPVDQQKEPVAVQQPAKRIKSKFLHHPFTEADYLKR